MNYANINNCVGVIIAQCKMYKKAKEMPLLVNAGVLFEVFLDIFILGIFVNLIQKEFKNLDVSKLSELKDSGND